MQHLPIRTNRLLIGIIIASVIIRIAATIYLGNQVIVLPGTADQVSYHALALRVLDGYGFTFGQDWWPATKADAPTAHWSYLYTSYLVLIYRLFGPHPLMARLLQAILVGILQPLLAYLITRRLFGNIVGLVSAAWIALYGYFIYYAGTLMTEPFYITAILGSLYLAILLVDRAIELEGQNRPTKYYLLALALGLVLGITILFRQLFLLLIPVIFIWIWWSTRVKRGKNTLPALLTATAVISLLILPFTAFNYSRFERFVLLNTNAGYAFFWANHPVYGTHFEPIIPVELGNYYDLIPKELLYLDEAAMDQALLKQGLQFVLDDPVRYLRLSVSRIPAYFMFWPLATSGIVSNITRVTSFGIALPFMLLGIWLWFKERFADGIKLLLASPGALLLLTAFTYTVIHLLTWALVRYRLPVDAILIIFAANGVLQLIFRTKTKYNSYRSKFGME